MGFAVLLGLTCLCVVAFGGLRPFNNDGYLCHSNADFVVAVNTTEQLRKPQFADCSLPPPNYSGGGRQRDHFIELQVLKAFVNEGNPLSCATVNFLNMFRYNGAANVRCFSASANAQKGRFFEHILAERNCSSSYREVLKCYMMGSATVTSTGGAGHTCRPDHPWGCCQTDTTHSDENFFNNLLNQAMTLGFTIYNDLVDIRRFLDYKILKACNP